jgi:hypothetical protein
MDRSTYDWRSNLELVAAREKLAVERVKLQEAAGRVEPAEARLLQLEQQVEDAEAFASIGKVSPQEVEKARAAVELHRKVLREHRGNAAVAAREIQKLERALPVLERDAVQKADEAIRVRAGLLVAELEEALPKVVALNEELDHLDAVARLTFPANGEDAERVKRAGVPIQAGFQTSLSFQRPPNTRTLEAWREYANGALAHSQRVSKRLRGEVA